jgi:hypothetical protein
MSTLSSSQGPPRERSDVKGLPKKLDSRRHDTRRTLTRMETRNEVHSLFVNAELN